MTELALGYRIVYQGLEISEAWRLPVAAAGAASEAHIGQVGGHIAVVSATATLQPAVSAGYASGDLIANSATAGSVMPFTIPVARVNDGTGMIRRVRLKTTDMAWASKNVRIHFYKDAPICTTGDSAAWQTTESNYLGYVDILLDRHFSDAEKGIGVPAVGSEFNFEPAVGTKNIFALLEARDTVTGTASKLWTLVLEVHQN